MNGKNQAEEIMKTKQSRLTVATVSKGNAKTPKENFLVKNHSKIYEDILESKIAINYLIGWMKEMVFLLIRKKRS